MTANILIIDDDMETLRLVGLMLQKQGFQIQAANNGTQGIALAQKEKPDLIVLDVMMPDVDGLAVTRQLRANPETSDIPILMFTAKSQVDDKVAGYEAGADDYLTKPVHPVELVAHIKALLARRKVRPAQEPTLSRKGYTLGVIGPKGGLGVSTVALNLGIALYDKTKADIICAEMRPGNGTWGVELGFSDTNGLVNILKKPAEEISENDILENLVLTTFGPRLLLTSPKIVDIDLRNHGAQLETLIQKMMQITQLTILDLGSGTHPVIEHMVKLCQEVIILTEAQPVSVRRTRLLLDEMNKQGFGSNKLVNVLIVNRMRADIQLTQTQMHEKLGVNPILVIPPAPELAYQAAIHFQPMVKMQPESLITQQFSRLADHFIGRIR